MRETNQQVIYRGALTLVADDSMPKDMLDVRNGGYWLRYALADDRFTLMWESYDAGRNWHRIPSLPATPTRPEEGAER